MSDGSIVKSSYKCINVYCVIYKKKTKSKTIITKRRSLIIYQNKNYSKRKDNSKIDHSFITTK